MGLDDDVFISVSINTETLDRKSNLLVYAMKDRAMAVEFADEKIRQSCKSQSAIYKWVFQK